jgi:riboflavin kinase/FMN adenylyltransferase
VPGEKLIPAAGVYVAYATMRGATYPAAVNIGVRPTFGAGGHTVEAHLLGADVNAYGERLDLAFVDRLRDERRFAGADELVAQIRADLAKVNDILSVRPTVDSVDIL